MQARIAAVVSFGLCLLSFVLPLVLRIEVSGGGYDAGRYEMQSFVAGFMKPSAAASWRVTTASCALQMERLTGVQLIVPGTREGTKARDTSPVVGPSLEPPMSNPLAIGLLLAALAGFATALKRFAGIATFCGGCGCLLIVLFVLSNPATDITSEAIAEAFRRDGSRVSIVSMSYLYGGWLIAASYLAATAASMFAWMARARVSQVAPAGR